MSEIVKNLWERTSIRAFSERNITPEEKEIILESACQAPTAGNQQLYTILDITDQKLKERLAETCDHQPFIAQAKMVLIFLADCQKWQDVYLAAGESPRNPGLGDLFLAMDDALIAAQNAVTAAQALGIGSCYIGDIMEHWEVHKELLHLTDWVFPAAMVVFGFPHENQKNKKKPKRFDKQYIVQENGYHPMAEDELKAMFQERTEKEGFDNWVKAFHRRKYDSGFAREMSRSVQAFVDNFEAGGKQ